MHEKERESERENDVRATVLKYIFSTAKRNMGEYRHVTSFQST